jgi:hypothetical protein
MKARSSFPFATLVLVLLLGGVLPATAHPLDEGAPPGPNIRVTLTIGDSESKSGFRERNYRTIARIHQRTELMMGWRTPIPQKRREVTTDGDAPVIAYTYQNIGVTGQLELDMIGDKILANLQVEVSGPKEGAGEAARSDAPPIIGTFQQQLVVVLTDGKSLRIAEVPDHEGGSLYLEVTAEVLD